MSEKRFIFNGIDIEDNKKGIEYNTFMKEGCEKIANQLNELSEENEQLRNSIQSFLKEADIFSEEATEHDIVAYREMGKFDNKDAYYLACAIAELKKVIDDE